MKENKLIGMLLDLLVFFEPIFASDKSTWLVNLPSQETVFTLVSHSEEVFTLVSQS